MKHGDFTELAKYYTNRPGYSKTVLECLKNHIFNCTGEGRVADIGAGTGKLTENLAELGLGGYAVEPNKAMRAEASDSLGGYFPGQKVLRKLQGLQITAYAGH